MGSCADDTGMCPHCGIYANSLCVAAIDEITAPFRTRAETAERERDEARAEVERLQGAFVASVDRWMEFVSHFQRLVRSNMGTEAGKLAIGYFKRAAEAGDLDEAGPPTITPRDAASERAAIVAMLHNEAFRLSAQADVTDDGYDANTMDDQARALRAAAERIERGKGDV